jgi:transcriptional regulator with XRE-family HTH domain
MFPNMGRKERVADHFRKRLRAERETRGWSQAQMAKMLSDRGVQMIGTTIAKIEAGDRAVRIDEATCIADLLDASLDSLLGRRAGLENDLINAVRGLQSAANESQRQLDDMIETIRSRLAELLELEFIGRDLLASRGEQALDALAYAQEALAGVAGFEVPNVTIVKLRRELVEERVLAMMSEVLTGSAESGTDEAES